MGNRAICLLPNLRTCGQIMRLFVVRVVKLVEYDAFAFCLHLLGKVARRLHVIDFNQCRPIRCHRVFTLLGRVARHNQRHRIAAHCRDHGKGDACIATGGLNDGVAWLDSATQFRLIKHVIGRAVFH